LCFSLIIPWGKETQPVRMWPKRRLLPKLPRVLFRLVAGDPRIRDAVAFGSHAIRSHMKLILQPWQLFILILDCYNESEQVSGFFSMLEDRLAVPFTTKLLGQVVTVEKVDLTEGNEIVAICRQGRHRQRVGILGLPLPNPRPDGSEWIEAYRHWARWR
jgi:hypothetical protein